MHCCSEAVKRFCMADIMAPSQSSQLVGHAACPRSLLTRILAVWLYTRSQGHTPGRNRRDAGTHISVVNVLEVQHERSPRSPPHARMSFIHDRWSWSLDLQCCEWTVESFSSLQGSDVFAAAVMRVFARVSKCFCSRWCVSLSLLRVPPSRLIHPLLKCGGKLARHELEVKALNQRVGVLVYLLQTEGSRSAPSL